MQFGVGSVGQYIIDLSIHMHAPVLLNSLNLLIKKVIKCSASLVLYQLFLKSFNNSIIHKHSCNRPLVKSA